MSAEMVYPRPGSYVNEWAAVQITGAESYSAVKILMKHSPWVVQMNLGADDQAEFLFTAQHAGVIEQWKQTAGDWVVKSPHGKFWFMDNDEFRHEFSQRAILE